MWRVGPVRQSAALLVVLSFSSIPSAPASAMDWADGRFQLHGYWATQLRWLSDSYQADDWYSSQWANTLNLELEADLAPDGFGPFELVQGFARIEVRYECAFTGCGVSGTHRHFGDRADRAPASNWVGGLTGGYAGNEPGVTPRRLIHDGETDLLTLADSPLIQPLFDLGATNVEATFAPVIDDLFAYRRYDGTREVGSIQLGPWNTESEIRPNGVGRLVPNPTSPLPLRPLVGNDYRGEDRAQGLFVPSHALRERLDEFDDFDQNFSEAELAWNHGGGQDEHELKELYVDIEMFDARLWLRIGKQNIVWGKTELFRTTDQFNPQDLALASLPSLEESRLALWSARAVWSFYDVGPLQDVRLEVAANYDDFEPIDLGRCGEPYTVWLVCGKSAGLWAHGLVGVGLAGEVRPPDPWDSSRGIEVGARVEFRWDRFSFAITDFYGYDDAPVLHAFNFYERNVDPRTGRPLDALGRRLTPERALEYHSGNRQLYDVFCSATVGVAAALLPGLEEACILDVLNASAFLEFGAPPPFDTVTPALAIGAVLAGNPLGEIVGEVFLTGNVALPAERRLTQLVADPADGPPGGLLGFAGMSTVLSDEQEALLGCGPFYGTSCDDDGVDLFNTEASVLIQSFPGFEPGGPVATRFVDGKLVILPGARGPGDPGYDRRVDGTPPAGFPSEMAALSSNFATFLGLLGLAGDTDDDCSLEDLIRCDIVRAVIAVTGVQRPEARAAGNGRFGRRDFLWLSGGEALLRYHKRNVLGFSMDFAEDRTKSNWSFEFTWIDDSIFGSNTSRTLNQEGDVVNLTVSADRPTFINFLNSNRTFFFNAQAFFQYLPDYNRSYTGNGPFNVLATFAVGTGYFQDRLLPSFVWVHDFPSSSGAVIAQVTYRYTQDFSISVGAPVFYGGPERAEIDLHQLALGNNGGDFTRRTRYSGLSPIAERDEIFVSLRYTF